jgi:hypothetical protein
MMYVCGDVRYPLVETTQVVESTVHSQITHVLVQAASIARRRGARSFSPEDLLFLIRKNSILCSRISYRECIMKIRSLKFCIGKVSGAHKNGSDITCQWRFLCLIKYLRGSGSCLTHISLVYEVRSKPPCTDVESIPATSNVLERPLSSAKHFISEFIKDLTSDSLQARCFF